MKKTSSSLPDFFSLYKKNRLHSFMLSTGIAFCIAFSFVTLIQGDFNTRGLMASVAQIAETPRQDADMIAHVGEKNIDIIFGARADGVDRIEVTLLGDPIRLQSLLASDSDTTIISDLTSGMYHVAIDMHGKNLIPGMLVTSLRLDMQSGAPIALASSEFISNGARYNLTTQVQ